MIKIILKFNGAVVKEELVVQEETTVGRKPDNDIVIDNPAVSGRHCRVFMEGGAFFVEDLNSTNGTYLRGVKITKVPLHHQDELAIAKHTLVFINDEEAAASAKAAPVSSDATVIMTAPRPAVSSSPSGVERVGHLKILVGGDISAKPVPLTALTTYIGKSEHAQIRLKGLFQPDLAAAISKKTDGYSLSALKDKTVKLNGDHVMDQAQVLLKEGDVIDVGPLKMTFMMLESV